MSKPEDISLLMNASSSLRNLGKKDMSYDRSSAEERCETIVGSENGSRITSMADRKIFPITAGTDVGFIPLMIDHNGQYGTEYQEVVPDSSERSGTRGSNERVGCEHYRNLYRKNENNR